MRILKDFWKAFLLPFLLIVILYVFVMGYVVINATQDNKTISDIIIVLGTEQENDSTGECLAARMDHAVELYNKSFAFKLILSGGDGQAQAMKKIANLADISSNDLLLDEDSHSTYESLVNAKSIMVQRNLVSAIIVSDTIHRSRASLVADKLGLNYSISPAIQSPCSKGLNFFSFSTFREALAIIVYKIEGKI